MAEKVLIERKTYRAAEVAKIFGVTNRTISNWVRNGTLRGGIVGGSLLINVDSVHNRLEDVGAA